MEQSEIDKEKEHFSNLSLEEKKAALGKMKMKIPFYSNAYRKEFHSEGGDAQQGQREESEVNEDEYILEQLDGQVKDILDQGAAGHESRTPVVAAPVGLSSAAPQETGETPPDIKAVISGIARYFDPKLEAVNTNICQIGQRVDIIEKKVIENDEHIQTVAKHTVKTRAVVVKNKARIKDLEVKQSSDIAQLNERCDKIQAEFSEKMEESFARLKEVEAITKRYRRGGFGSFSDIEAPTPKDHYDFMLSFNKSRQSVGFYPVYREDLAELQKNLNCREDESFRVAISQFLRLEMGFLENFVVHLESHYVELRYDGRDTLYAIFDNLDRSGGRRIWQEAQRLTKHSLGGRQVPELRQLEIPQLRDRRRGLEKVSNSMRHRWRELYPEAFAANQKLKTRVLEADDGTYDHIIQAKLPGPGQIYHTVVIPDGNGLKIRDTCHEDIARCVDTSVILPKIQWKVKSYINHTAAAMVPRRREDIMKPDFIPQGRTMVKIPLNRGPEELNMEYLATIHVMNPTYKFVPGMLDPGSPGSPKNEAISGMSLDAASNIGSGRTPITELSTESQDQVAKFRSVKEIENQSRQQRRSLFPPASSSASTQLMSNLSIAQQYFSSAQAPPATAPVTSGSSTAPISASSAATSSTPFVFSATASSTTTPLLGTNTNVTFSQAGSVPAHGQQQSAANVEPEPEKTGVTEEGHNAALKELAQLQQNELDNRMKYEEEVARLEKQLSELNEEHTKKEKQRYEEDVQRRELEAEIREQLAQDKDKRLERIERDRRNNPRRDLVTDVDDIDENKNQGNNIVVTPPPPVQPETGAVSRRKSIKTKLNRTRSVVQEETSETPGNDDTATQEVTQSETQPETQQEETVQAEMAARTLSTSQASMLSFITRRSSTLRDSVTEDNEEENYESAAEDTPKAPKFTSTQTAPLAVSSLAKKLEFQEKNYELVPITPSGAEGGTGEVTVKLPKPRTFADIMLNSSKKPRRKSSVSKIPKKQVPSISARNLFRKPGAQEENRKRAGSGEKSGVKEKKERCGSPGHSASRSPKLKDPPARTQGKAFCFTVSEIPEKIQFTDQPALDPQAQQQEAGASADARPPPGEGAAGPAAEETKEETMSVKSDDLSSLSVLFCEDIEGSEESKEAGSGDNTLEETIILGKESGDTTVDTTVDTDTTQDTVIEVAVKEKETELNEIVEEEGKKENELNKVVMVKDYNSDDNGSPDKPATPPPDHSGHMVSVHATANNMVIDSSIEGQSVMKKMSKQLVDKSAQMAVTPNTEQKKAQGSEID